MKATVRNNHLATHPCVNVSRVADIAKELIGFVVKKYGVQSYEDFTCPIHKRLAQELKWADLEGWERK